LEPEAAAAWEAAQPRPAPAPTADVVLYCTPWCPSCPRARAYLEEHGIEYTAPSLIKCSPLPERFGVQAKAPG
jgi:hypothetical protein